MVASGIPLEHVRTRLMFEHLTSVELYSLDVSGWSGCEDKWISFASFSWSSDSKLLTCTYKLFIKRF